MFHAKRGIQELNYDALKEIKILELSVCQTLRYVLPPDYVNWVRMSLYQNGVLRPLTENIQTNWSNAYLQDNDCNILFDIDGFYQLIKAQRTNFFCLKGRLYMRQLWIRDEKVNQFLLKRPGLSLATSSSRVYTSE